MSKPPDYKSVEEAFEALWTSKNLPMDCRRYTCGAVQQAGVRQGDEVFDVAIFQAVVNGDTLHPDQEMEMYESVHEFVLVEKRLRPQYLAIVVKMMVNYLNRNHIELAEKAAGVNGTALSD